MRFAFGLSKFATAIAFIAITFACIPGSAPEATTDAGSTDAGVAVDAGPSVDAGTSDAGTSDAGPSVDAGTSDAGPFVDAGSSDAGPFVDAGSPDAGTSDAGPSVDAGSPCDAGYFSTYRACCGGSVVNPQNDPDNCGGCGTHCQGATPYCGDGKCQATPCDPSWAASCGADGGWCCGAECCGPDQLCCEDEGPMSAAPYCFTPTADSATCPMGCAPLCVSDRDAKRDFAPVDDRAVLNALARLPVSTWSYKGDGASVRHLGPTAQDFRAAFGVGATDRAYDPVDAHGVAFSSIRALYAMIRDQDARIAKLERQNAELRRRLDRR